MKTNQTLETILGLSIAKQLPAVFKKIFNLMLSSSGLVIHYEDIIPYMDNYDIKCKQFKSDNGSYKTYIYDKEARLFYNIFNDKYKEIKELCREDYDGFIDIYYGLPKLGIYYKILDHKTFVICNVVSVLEDLINKNNNNNTFGIRQSYRFKYTFIGANADFYLDKYKRLCTYIYDARNNKRLRDSYKVVANINTDSDHGTEQYSIYMTAKPMKDIIMDKAVKRELLNKIKTFLNSAPIYKKNHIPYRLGILLHGSPGTGKTSLAYTLAYMLHCPVNIVNANTIIGCISHNEKYYVRKYGDLDTLSNKKFNIKGIVLIDEIDSLTKSDLKFTLRKDQILSFIDNLEEGIIVIGTTNSVEDIDPATIRPGRFDIHIKMDNFDRDLALEMIRSYQLDDSFADNFSYPIMPSELQFAITQELYKQVQ